VEEYKMKKLLVILGCLLVFFTAPSPAYAGGGLFGAAEKVLECSEMLLFRGNCFSSGKSKVKKQKKTYSSAQLSYMAKQAKAYKSSNSSKPKRLFNNPGGY
jgi:uncharacterized membrane protein required for colicin V production